MITNIIQFLHTTTAYQSAAFHLLVGEANFVWQQCDLKEAVPAYSAANTNEWMVLPPPMGVGGSVKSSNYVFSFTKGRLDSIYKVDWIKKVSPPITNQAELVNRPSLLDTNDAYQLATQWLTRLSVDVSALEQRWPPRVFQSAARKTAPDGSNLPGASNNVPVPLFQISWGDQKSPINAFNTVRVRILGTTKELLDLHIRDGSFFRRHALSITNAAELLGPLPPPRQFVERLVGGKDAYETVANPDKTEVWLLTSFDDESVRENKPRTRVVRLDFAEAKKFSRPLLDFNSYAWTVMKLCSPDYGAKLRFTKGKNVVEFLLCYECDILEVTFNAQTQTENFDYGHNKLVRALRAEFPTDTAIKKLKFNDDKPEDLLKLFQSQ